MRIKRSAIIIYSSSNWKIGMRNVKLTIYKNNRYLEMMKALLDEYSEIITVDTGDIYLSNLCNKENEERVIRQI